MDLVDLAQDRDRWRALGKAIMSLRVRQNAGNCLTTENRLDSQEGLLTVE